MRKDYLVIEFNKTRAELCRTEYHYYTDAEKHKICDISGYGLQILKRHKNGYWFPLSEFYK